MNNNLNLKRKESTDNSKVLLKIPKISILGPKTSYNMSLDKNNDNNIDIFQYPSVSSFNFNNIDTDNIQPPPPHPSKLFSDMSKISSVNNIDQNISKLNDNEYNKEYIKTDNIISNDKLFINELPPQPNSFHPLTRAQMTGTSNSSEAALKLVNYNEGIPDKQIYIKNLSKYTTEDDLKIIFKNYNYTDVIVGKGRLRRQGFVTFDTINDATIVLKKFHLTMCKNKQMIISYSDRNNKNNNNDNDNNDNNSDNDNDNDNNSDTIVSTVKDDIPNPNIIFL